MSAPIQQTKKREEHLKSVKSVKKCDSVHRSQKTHCGDKSWFKMTLLTCIVKGYLPAAVCQSRPRAVVDGPCLHYPRLGCVCLGSPHQHTDSNWDEKKNRKACRSTM